MKRLVILLAPSILFVAAACGNKTPESSPKVTSSPTVSAAASPTPTPSVTHTPTSRPSPNETSSPKPLGPVFSGIVTNTSGKGLAGVCISPIEPSNDDRFRWKAAVTDSAGRFSVDMKIGPYSGKWAMEYWDCNAHPMYAPEMTSVDVSSSNVAAHLKGALSTGAAITGVAVDQSGHPAAGVCVSSYDGSHVASGGTTVRPEYKVHADSTGHFTISGLSSRTQKLEFGTCTGSQFKVEWWKDRSNEAPQYGNYENSDPINVAAGQTTNVGTVDLTRI